MENSEHKFNFITFIQILFINAIIAFSVSNIVFSCLISLMRVSLSKYYRVLSFQLKDFEFLSSLIINYFTLLTQYYYVLLFVGGAIIIICFAYLGFMFKKISPKKLNIKVLLPVMFPVLLFVFLANGINFLSEALFILLKDLRLVETFLIINTLFLSVTTIFIGLLYFSLCQLQIQHKIVISILFVMACLLPEYYIYYYLMEITAKINP